LLERKGRLFKRKTDGVRQEKDVKTCKRATCGRWCSVSDSLPAYGAIGSAVGRADGTALNLGVVQTRNGCGR
jgi:hypothetical protein